MGIVEAKKLAVGAQSVLVQAERYSRGLHQGPLQSGEFGAPFLYSTNGELIFYHDVRDEMNLSRSVTGFHTTEALQEWLGRNLDDAVQTLKSIPNDEARLRPYQREVNGAIEQAIEHLKRSSGRNRLSSTVKVHQA